MYFWRRQETSNVISGLIVNLTRGSYPRSQARFSNELDARYVSVHDGHLRHLRIYKVYKSLVYAETVLLIRSNVSLGNDTEDLNSKLRSEIVI